MKKKSNPGSVLLTVGLIMFLAAIFMATVPLSLNLRAFEKAQDKKANRAKEFDAMHESSDYLVVDMQSSIHTMKLEGIGTLISDTDGIPVMLINESKMRSESFNAGLVDYDNYWLLTPSAVDEYDATEYAPDTYEGKCVVPVYEAQYFIVGFLGHPSGLEVFPGIACMLMAFPMGIVSIILLIAGGITKAKARS